MTDVHLNVSGKFHPMPLYLRGAFSRRRGLRSGERLKEMKVDWKGFRIDPVHLKKVTALCGLTPESTMPLIYPLTFLFPLHMIMITHREFPLFFLKMLHVRDHVLQHRRIDIEEQMDICCMTSGQRVIAKGIEFDIHSIMSVAGDPVWESISTNFFPGSFGEPDGPSPLAVFDPIPEGHSTVDWTMPEGNRFKFGLLTGDYNGIHYLAPYARMMGFRRDFSHGQRSVAECLRRLPPLHGDGPVRLSLALKGPVYYGSRVIMKYATLEGGFRFDLLASGEQRPSIMGSLFHNGDSFNNHRKA